MMTTFTAAITTDPTLIEFAATYGAVLEFPPCHIIFAQGEPGYELYIIQSGKVKIVQRAHNGRENLVMVHGVSESFGELSLVDGHPREATATTVTETRVTVIDRATLRQWLAAKPELVENMMQVLAKRVRRVSSQLSDHIFIDAAARLAKVLLLLSQRFGTYERGYLRVTHDLTQEELAQFIGSSRETVNKVLSDFAGRGWLRVEGKSVLILDVDSLARRVR
ncbi:Crp/Fnr family transcriptional regulator [Nocardia sp. NRRL S-836]|uniref:Crp/Fnr family transcriptional regulator n=1 Tax=Nocardia sp. NRRL S-836 TaxID=1519492 RepID=UPI0018D078E4|nr:Crp/Fnr family transcriptional regulator [Nocardia sp. NRRL S-836]